LYVHIPLTEQCSQVASAVHATRMWFCRRSRGKCDTDGPGFGRFLWSTKDDGELADPNALRATYTHHVSCSVLTLSVDGRVLVGDKGETGETGEDGLLGVEMSGCGAVAARAWINGTADTGTPLDVADRSAVEAWEPR